MPENAGAAVAFVMSPADITSLLQALDSGSGDGRQYFYLGRIASWDFAARTGPEFSEPGGGTYQLEQIPLTAGGLGAIDLKPAAVAGLLHDAVAAGRDLFTLPDLRSGPALRMGGSGVVRCVPDEGVEHLAHRFGVAAHDRGGGLDVADGVNVLPGEREPRRRG